MVTYMHKKWRLLVKTEGITPQTVAAAVKLHLVAPFERELKLKGTALTWDGPEIGIIPRPQKYTRVMNAVGSQEWPELPEQPIYVGGDGYFYQDDWSDDDSE